MVVIWQWSQCVTVLVGAAVGSSDRAVWFVNASGPDEVDVLGLKDAVAIRGIVLVHEVYNLLMTSGAD